MAGRRPRGTRRSALPEQTLAGDCVVVNGYSENWLRQGFPWVYRDEVVGRTGGLVPGRVVEIRSRKGEVLGTGVWDEGRVEVRRFRRDAGPIDEALLRDRVKLARVRRPLPAATTAWRWLHGENDDTPGIRVDVYGHDLVVILDSASLEGLLNPLVQALRDEWEVRSIWLAWRPPPEDERTPKSGEVRQLFGPELDRSVDVEVLERGIRVGVRPWEGPDVGLYSDMRDVRAWLEPHWDGRRVLNLFAYTGMFSVAAARHGATEVHTVDLAAPCLDRARVNFERNGLPTDAHIFDQADALRALDARRRKGETFGLIVADPPGYARGPAGVWSISKDLPRLVAGCLRVLEPGGWLVVASNLGTMSPKEFQTAVHKGATKAGRSLRLLHQGSPPLDYPAALDFPESRYLKCWVLQA